MHVVHQNEEAFLEALNISVGKKTQTDILHKADVGKGLVWVAAAHVCTVLQRKKVIYDWRQQIK